jgi:hypothetical protein
MLVGQVHTGMEVAAGISVVTGVMPVTGNGVELINGATGCQGAHAVSVNSISSKIIEIFIGMLLRLLLKKT